jgi:hypothetical protein
MPALLLSQTKISGKVIDSENQPLPGANVFIKDSYDGASSKADGSYSFTTEEEGSVILVVSFIGYKTKEEILLSKLYWRRMRKNLVRL